MLNAFKLQPFDLEPVFAAWTDAPRFLGDPKKDPPVDNWLAQIKAGCKERKVPKDYWHKAAQHYLGPKAKARLDEVKQVMKNMHGGKFKWDWKSFKVAMRNMGWDIDTSKTEEIKVASKPSGFWWAIGKNTPDSPEKESEPSPPVHPRPPLKSKSTWDISTPFKNIPTPKRSSTMSSIETVSSSPSSSAKSTAPTTPAHTPSITPDSTPGSTMTTIANAPLWLVNACQSLEFITSEHPKVMTALSAVLITVGSLPALPAISAGAGGAFLASSTAHALGSLAIGLGTLLKAQTEGQLNTNGAVKA